MTASKMTLNRLEAAKVKTIKKFGVAAASLGDEKTETLVVPSPSLMLDYMLGIGGFPYGHMVEIFGAYGLGKTSALGYGTLANVQKQDKLPALIAMEPTFDAEWARKLFGLDESMLLINRPDNAEQAMEMLYDLVFGGLVDYILIDSFGAMGTKSESEGGGKKAYGPSGVITSGLNAVMPRAYKNKVGIMGINQQRQTGTFQGNTTYDSPGGEGLKHHAMIRIHLKPGEQYKAAVDGENIMVGRDLVCTFRKNKLAQASNKKANFPFFHIETPEYGLGVDTAGDYLNVGRVAGVIQGSSQWPEHHTFPGGKLNGKAKVAEFLRGNPKAKEVIRKEVMEKMTQRELKAAEENTRRVELEDDDDDS